MTSASETLQPADGTLDWLLSIVRRLLGPDGCPWDREQDLQSLRPFLLEESYEVLDAIDDGDRDHHREELGDVLFQIVFQAELAGIALEEIIRGIGHKLIRRHPHVFGDTTVQSSAEVVVNWERLKAAERADQPQRALRGVPRAMPALQRSDRLVYRAARAGFDWPGPEGARAKIDEELAEADAAVADPERFAEEVGDLLFAVTAWARKLGAEPEDALRAATFRFERRFERMEDALRAEGRALDECSLDEMLERWRRARSA